jgi:hypothetical protein
MLVVFFTPVFIAAAEAEVVQSVSRSVDQSDMIASMLSTRLLYCCCCSDTRH